jgi:choline dehydrogenase-like flavoprotein
MSSSSQMVEGVWDAIVVGSGASGGVAAMTLAEGGARVLVIDAGPNLSSCEALTTEPGNLMRRLAGLISGQHRRQAQHPGYWKANPRYTPMSGCILSPSARSSVSLDPWFASGRSQPHLGRHHPSTVR